MARAPLLDVHLLGRGRSGMLVRHTPEPQLEWPAAVPRHLHFTLPDTRCMNFPMSKYCAYFGGNPEAFLRQAWSTLNPDFDLTVHNDSDCKRFMQSFSAAARASGGPPILLGLYPKGYTLRVITLRVIP